MATTYICKSCAGLAPVGIGYAAEGTAAEAQQCARARVGRLCPDSKRRAGNFTGPLRHRIGRTPA